MLQTLAANPVPTLTAVTPDPVPLAIPTTPGEAATFGASISLTFAGADFVPGSVVHWNDRTLATTTISSTQLRARVTDDIMALGTTNVSVQNPAPGGGTSNVLPISVVNPPPVLYGLRPSTVGAGGAFNLEVSGNNFTPGSSVRWNGSERPTVWHGALWITAAISAADTAAPGTSEITVFTPEPGGGTSQRAILTLVTP